LLTGQLDPKSRHAGGHFNAILNASAVECISQPHTATWDLEKKRYRFRQVAHIRSLAVRKPLYHFLN
jgi:hypothetical protein